MKQESTADAARAWSRSFRWCDNWKGLGTILGTNDEKPVETRTEDRVIHITQVAWGIASGLDGDNAVA
jgi:hypothetical protein